MGTWFDEKNEGKAFAEKFFLLYAPFWIIAVGCVVGFEWYAWFSARDYFCFGVACALPAWFLPPFFQPKSQAVLPLSERYW